MSLETWLRSKHYHGTSCLQPTLPAMEWRFFADDKAFIESAVTRIKKAADEAIGARGCFHLVLAGGTTPKKLYQELATLNICCSAWHIDFTDERCLPVNAEGRNDHMAKAAWLDHVTIGSVRSLPAELGPRAGAEKADAWLQQPEYFDLVLLGLGEDGHTASLFSALDSDIEENTAAVLPVVNAPKFPAERITLSLDRLCRTREALLMTEVGTKKYALQALTEGKNRLFNHLSSKTRVTGLICL